jgi:hypothetical protein
LAVTGCKRRSKSLVSIARTKISTTAPIVSRLSNRVSLDIDDTASASDGAIFGAKGKHLACRRARCQIEAEEIPPPCRSGRMAHLSRSRSDEPSISRIDAGERAAHGRMSWKTISIKLKS